MSSSQHPRSRGSDWLALGRAQIRVPIGIAAAYDGPVLGRFARAAAGRSARRRCRSAACRRSSFGQGGEQGRGRPRFSSPASPGEGASIRRSSGSAAAWRRWASGHRGRAGGSRRGRVDAGGSEPGREAVEEVLCRPDAARSGISLLGVSGGGTLALRTAADPRLTERVSIVLALAPLCGRGGDSGRHDGRLPGRIRARAVHGR